MKVPAIGTRRQALLFGVLALLLLFFVVKWRGRDPAASPPPVAGPVASGGDEPRPAIGRRPRPRAAEPEDVPLITARDLEPLFGAGEGARGATCSTSESRRRGPRRSRRPRRRRRPRLVSPDSSARFLRPVRRRPRCPRSLNSG